LLHNKYLATEDTEKNTGKNRKIYVFNSWFVEKPNSRAAGQQGHKFKEQKAQVKTGGI